MTLADEALKELQAMKGNPAFTHLSDEAVAICQAIERRLRQYQKRKLNTAYAEGIEPQKTAMSKVKYVDIE